MLETFRKHHYILMLLVAIVVVISFTFLSNPSDSGRPGGSGSQRVFTLYNGDVNVNEVQSIEQQMRIAMQLAQMSQDRQDGDPVSSFVQEMSSIVNTANPTDRSSLDLDPPKNILVMRHEAENLGIDVEREDIEKFIKVIGAFKSNGGFDAKKLDGFLNSGLHGDRAATESKLFTTLRDVMRFQRIAQLVGGTFPPSKAEVDADYAEKNQKITAATVLIAKKPFEEQAVTDEDIQKFYDGEKAKHEAKAAEEPKKDAKAPPLPGADPLVLSEEKRTVKYVVTELAKAPTAPVPPPPLPPLGDISALPEDQKKAKEEEQKKKEEENKKKQEEYTKANEEYQKKVAEHTTAKNVWLKSVEDLSNSLANTEERAGKSFEDVAKALKFEVKTATFTKAAAPEEIKKIKPRGGNSPDEAIFDAPLNGSEELMEDASQTSFGFFTVTQIEKSSVLPLDGIKQKISDKLKAEKVTNALKAAGESARSNLLEALQGGKPLKEAVEIARGKLLETLKKEPTFKEADAATALTSKELPAYSKSKPLPPDPQSATVSKEAEKLNPGEVSPPEPVTDGLLLVYVEKKELPKHPDMEQQKKDLAKNHTFTGAAASMGGGFNQANMQEMIDKYEYFGKFGGYTNPVLKAWFAESRRVAETVTE